MIEVIDLVKVLELLHDLKLLLQLVTDFAGADGALTAALPRQAGRDASLRPDFSQLGVILRQRGHAPLSLVHGGGTLPPVGRLIVVTLAVLVYAHLLGRLHLEQIPRLAARGVGSLHALAVAQRLADVEAVIDLLRCGWVTLHGCVPLPIGDVAAELAIVEIVTHLKVRILDLVLLQFGDGWALVTRQHRCIFLQILIIARLVPHAVVGLPPRGRLLHPFLTRLRKQL